MRNDASGSQGGGTRRRAIHTLIPLGIMLGVWLLLLVPATRAAMLANLEEGRFVELATFLLFLAGGLLGIRSVVRATAFGAAPSVIAFHTCVAAALLILAGEEAAWGQRVFGWETPPVWDNYNRQDETTLHNMGPLQGRTEWMRLAFGLCGVAGVLAGVMGHLRQLAPPVRLLPWFLVVVVFTVPDIVNDHMTFRSWTQEAVNKSSEAVECVIALAGLAYVLVMGGELSRRGPGPWRTL